MESPRAKDRISFDPKQQPEQSGGDDLREASVVITHWGDAMPYQLAQRFTGPALEVTQFVREQGSLYGIRQRPGGKHVILPKCGELFWDLQDWQLPFKLRLERPNGQASGQPVTSSHNAVIILHRKFAQENCGVFEPRPNVFAFPTNLGMVMICDYG